MMIVLCMLMISDYYDDLFSVSSDDVCFQINAISL